MKKKLLTILGCVAFGSAMAQTDLPRVEVFEAQGAVLDSIIPGSHVQGVSYNGEWAVGHGTEYTQYSFIWNKTTGEYSLITGSYQDIAYAYSVSNDGTVVGAFYRWIGLHDSRNLERQCMDCTSHGKQLYPHRRIGSQRKW